MNRCWGYSCNSRRTGAKHKYSFRFLKTCSDVLGFVIRTKLHVSYQTSSGSCVEALYVNLISVKLHLSYYYTFLLLVVCYFVMCPAFMLSRAYWELWKFLSLYVLLLWLVIGPVGLIVMITVYFCSFYLACVFYSVICITVFF